MISNRIFYKIDLFLLKAHIAKESHLYEKNFKNRRSKPSFLPSALNLQAEANKKKQGIASQKETPKAKVEPCDFKLFGNDRMQFVDKKKSIVKSITVPRSCSQFTVHFEYDGKMKSNIMGHNWILTEKENKEKVSQNALKSGIKNNYLPDASMSSLVIAGSTKILGGGEGDFQKEDIVIDMNKIKDNKEYVYFCAFPGHALIMKGVFMREKAPVKEKTPPKKKAVPDKVSKPAKK